MASVGPISAAMGSSDAAFQFYSSGIYSSNNCKIIDHSVTIVGYSSDYYIVKNSWGDLFV